jgi:HEPN domain-containing protein
LAAARRGLREGTPAALRRSVAQACNAVESTLKVLLTEHGWPIPSGHGVDALLGACRAAELLPPAAEEILAGPARFANRRGDHDVERDEAEAAMAAAAVASKFIAGRLPDPPASGAGE